MGGIVVGGPQGSRAGSRAVPEIAVLNGPGGSFADMVDLKGTKEIGDGINKVTWTMARMNMILHGRVAAEIKPDNTLAAPRFTEGPGVSNGSTSRSPIHRSPTRPGRTGSTRPTTNTAGSNTVSRRPRTAMCVPGGDGGVDGGGAAAGAGTGQ